MSGAKIALGSFCIVLFCGKKPACKEINAKSVGFIFVNVSTLCADIIREEIKELAPHHERSELPTPLRNPANILIHYVIGQELAKSMAVAVYNHI